MLWNDFNRHSLAMFVKWYIWSSGFYSVAKKYDSQIVLRSTVYRKSMAGFIFIWSYFGPEKTKSISKFQKLQCKRVCKSI
jgi:hypothetical protein